MSIDTKQGEFTKIEPLTKLSDSLLGGTRTMRIATEAYLPKFQNEDDKAYERRLKVSVLYPAYSETIEQMLGRVFFKSIDRTSIKIDDALLEDFNMNGDDIDSVLTLPFRDALAYSRSYVLVTAPDGSEAKTVEDEKTLGIRPYAVVISPKQVLGIRRDKGRIIEFRYKTTTLEVTSDYEEVEKEQVVIHTPGNVKIYEKSDDKKDGGFTLVSDLDIKAKGKLLEVVPVAELIFKKDGLPLENLAYLNVKHWQSQSDQDNILTFARVPILKIVGVEDNTQIEVGSSALKLPENSDASWIEHSGAAIGAGQESLDKLEAQMQSAGAKLLTRTKLSMTDSQAKEEQSKEISQLRHYANKTEDFAEKILYFFALFLGKDDGGRIEISGNIDADFDSSASMQMVLEGFKNGAISKQTTLEEFQKRGIVSDTVDWEVEQVRISVQGG